ncbi:MAG: LysR family transcriptional regulator [Pseudomonadota bacterium]
MSDISSVQVRKLDFMLLLVLREGVRRRKLSDVAATIGVTQTAISHSVARLRDLFDDELFIRKPHGVEPTERAVQLAEIAEQVIEGAIRMLVDPVPFEPARVERNIRICALDYEVTLMSEVIETLRHKTPGIRLHIRATGRDASIAALERDEADLWLGFGRDLPTTLESTQLFEESYKVISRADHPRLAGHVPLDLETFCAEGHVVAAPGGTAGGVVDASLRSLDRSRSVAILTTGFLSAVDLVSRTDLIATIPARLAIGKAERFGLQVFDPPLMLRPFQVSATWHRRLSSDSAIFWLIDHLRDGLGPDADAGMSR